MTDYSKLWKKTDIGAEALAPLHDYHVGENSEGPRFPRLEAFDAAEPSEHGDDWKAWHRTRSREVLGEGRVTRRNFGYTVFPDDRDTNAAILGVANKYIPAHFDDRGLPCEDFRDLCAHLALCVVPLSDGTYSTSFLANDAARYIRKTMAPQSVTIEKLNKRKRT